MVRTSGFHPENLGFESQWGHRAKLGVSKLSLLTGLGSNFALMYYVYILFSEKDKQLYTGFTGDLRSRIKAHLGGFVKATQNRKPLKLIYYESYDQESDARKREKYLKGGKGGKGRGELKVQLSGTFLKCGYKNL